MALRADLGVFDVVLAANLLCRLPDPRVFLARVPELVKAGGQLLLTTPFTWLEEFTPRDKWIGGTGENGSADELTRLLEPHFELKLSKEIPFLIREHARKYQWSVAWGTRWVRK
jgi:SAM-dependent methyltransferase